MLRDALADVQTERWHFAVEFFAKPWQSELRFAQIGEAAPLVVDPLAFAIGAN
jgi:hypothetical protein